MNKPLSTGRPLRVAVLAAAAVAGVWALLRHVVGFGGVPFHVDYAVYRAGGRAVLDAVDLYEGSYQVGTISLPFTYPPLSALLFIPLALIPAQFGSALFTVVSIAALFVTVTIVLTALAGEGDRPLSRRHCLTLAAVATVGALWMWPVFSTLDFGQINILLMLLVVADLLLPRTPWPRGLLIGLAAALKLTPAVFGLYFLLRRQWRDAAVSVLSGIGFSALAWLALPGDSHRYWTDTLRDPTRIGDLSYSSNQSWRGMVARFTGDPTQTRIWIVLAGVTVVLVILVMLRQLAVGAVTAAVCTNSLLALLASPVSWSHHWVWVVPMVMAAAASWWWGGRRTALVLAVVMTVVPVALAAHTWFPSSGGAESDWNLLMKILGSEFVLLGVAWLTVSGLSPRSTTPADPGIRAVQSR